MATVNEQELSNYVHNVHDAHCNQTSLVSNGLPGINTHVGHVVPHPPLSWQRPRSLSGPTRCLYPIAEDSRETELGAVKASSVGRIPRRSTSEPALANIQINFNSTGHGAVTDTDVRPIEPARELQGAKEPEPVGPDAAAPLVSGGWAQRLLDMFRGCCRRCTTMLLAVVVATVAIAVSVGLPAPDRTLQVAQDYGPSPAHARLDWTLEAPPASREASPLAIRAERHLVSWRNLIGCGVCKCVEPSEDHGHDRGVVVHGEMRVRERILATDPRWCESQEAVAQKFGQEVDGLVYLMDQIVNFGVEGGSITSVLRDIAASAERIRRTRLPCPVYRFFDSFVENPCTSAVPLYHLVAARDALDELAGRGLVPARDVYRRTLTIFNQMQRKDRDVVAEIDRQSSDLPAGRAGEAALEQLHGLSVQYQAASLFARSMLDQLQRADSATLSLQNDISRTQGRLRARLAAVSEGPPDLSPRQVLQELGWLQSELNSTAVKIVSFACSTDPGRC